MRASIKVVLIYTIEFNDINIIIGTKFCQGVQLRKHFINTNFQFGHVKSLNGQYVEKRIIYLQYIQSRGKIAESMV